MPAPIISLPVCRWRGSSCCGPQRYQCSSPKLVVGPNGVHADHCRQCYLADHEPPSETEMVHLRQPMESVEVAIPMSRQDVSTTPQQGCGSCGGRRAQEPGLFQKAVNLGKAVTQHIATGMKLVTDEQKVARLAVCETCSQFTPQRTCAKCGCYMDVKAGWGEQHCPLDLWPSLPQDTE